MISAKEAKELTATLLNIDDVLNMIDPWIRDAAHKGKYSIKVDFHSMHDYNLSKFEKESICMRLLILGYRVKGVSNELTKDGYLIDNSDVIVISWEGA